MTLIAIIGGSGFDTFAALSDTREIQMETPYGQHSSGVMVVGS